MAALLMQAVGKRASYTPASYVKWLEMAGARVTLVYANRHASQILYHDRLRALLAWPSYPRGVDTANLDRIAEGMKRYGMLTSVPKAESYLYETGRVH